MNLFVLYYVCLLLLYNAQQYSRIVTAKFVSIVMSQLQVISNFEDLSLTWAKLAWQMHKQKIFN